MVRAISIVLLAVSLASCGDQSGPLDGTWGWFDPAVCEGNRDTIEFAGRDFFHRRNGEVFVRGQNVRYHETDESGATWITATYGVEVPRAPDPAAEDGEARDPEMVTRSVSLTFEPMTENTLIFRGSVVDGVAPPNAANVIGRQLYRCVDGEAVLDDANGDGLLDAE
jgi:hypothetical protein